MTEEIVGAKVTCFALIVDVFGEVAERAELEEGDGGRATEGVDDGVAEEAVLEEGDEGRATEGVDFEEQALSLLNLTSISSKMSEFASDSHSSSSSSSSLGLYSSTSGSLSSSSSS